MQHGSERRRHPGHRGGRTHRSWQQHEELVKALMIVDLDSSSGAVLKKAKAAGINFSKAGPKFLVNGAVLLLFASIDALTRKRERAT